LELFTFGKVERGQALREALDALGGLQARRLIVGSEVLNGLESDTSETVPTKGPKRTSTSIVRRFSETVRGGSGFGGRG
jgi:hypothetical protein